MPNSSIKKLGRGCGGVGAVAWVAAPAEIAVRQTAAHADLPRFAFGVELPPPPPRFLPSSRELGLLGSGRGYPGGSKGHAFVGRRVLQHVNGQRQLLRGQADLLQIWIFSRTATRDRQISQKFPRAAGKF